MHEHDVRGPGLGGSGLGHGATQSDQRGSGEEERVGFHYRIISWRLATEWPRSPDGGSYKRGGSPIYFGAIRSAPSRRITSPLIMAFSTMCSTSAAYSSGLPKRVGNGTLAARLSCTFCGMPSSKGVAKSPGAIALTRIPVRANSRAAGKVSATMPPLEAE